MSRNLSNLLQARDEAKFAGTLRGSVYALCGKFFGCYCVIRILGVCILPLPASIFFARSNILSQSALNVVIPPGSYFRPSSGQSTNYPDLVTDLIARTLSFFSFAPSGPEASVRIEDIAKIARQLSLVLVGMIILTSVRTVLRGVTRVLRVTSRRRGASLMVMVLAQLMVGLAQFSFVTYVCSPSINFFILLLPSTGNLSPFNDCPTTELVSSSFFNSSSSGRISHAGCWG
jgi:hypothetical protein